MANPPYLSEPVKVSTDPDMEIAQYLVQLSGEDVRVKDESSNSNNYENKSKNESQVENKNQKQNDVSSSSSNTEGEILVGRQRVSFKPKKRRYRSIASIYGSPKSLEVTLQAKKIRMRC